MVQTPKGNSEHLHSCWNCSGMARRRSARVVQALWQSEPRWLWQLMEGRHVGHWYEIRVHEAPDPRRGIASAWCTGEGIFTRPTVS